MQLVGRRPDEGLEVPFIYTGAAPEDQPQPPGRISIGDLASQGWPADASAGRPRASDQLSA